MLTIAAAGTIQAVATNATTLTYTISGMELSVALGEVYKPLAQGQIASSVAAIYTVPASTTAFVKEIRIASTSGSSQGGVILYVNGTAAANQITGTMTIPANGLLVIGDSVQVFDANGNLYTAPNNISGVSTSITAASAGVNSSEVSIASITIPANTLNAGTTYHLFGSGVCTSSVANVSNFRARIGTAGTSSDAIATVVTPTAAASGTTIPFVIQLWVTVRAIGSSGTALGSGVLSNNGVTGVSAAAVVANQVTATITVNTTVANILQLSYVAAASTTTCTFHNAFIEPVKV